MSITAPEVDKAAALALVDPTSFTPWVKPSAADPFDISDPNYGYARTVLASKNLLVATDGLYGINGPGLIKLLSDVVLDPARLVTSANQDRLSEITLDASDILGVVWGRPATDVEDFAGEVEWLTNLAWGKLTPKGDVAKSKYIPHGTVIVDTGSKTQTRIVTNPDGTQVPMPVRLRFATTMSEHMLNFTVAPALDRAMDSMTKAINLAMKGMDEFPNEKALFANRLTAAVSQFNGLAAPALNKAGLTLTPAAVGQNGLKRLKNASTTPSE